VVHEERTIPAGYIVNCCLSILIILMVNEGSAVRVMGSTGLVHNEQVLLTILGSGKMLAVNAATTIHELSMRKIYVSEYG
jgi:hypothetical protein